MAATDLLERHPAPSREEIVDCSPATSAAAPATSRSWRRSSRPRRAGGDVNLALSLLSAAERTPDAEAVVDGDVRLTYAELRERAARLANGLAERGRVRGDRVAAVARNRRETVQLFWACQWLGAVFVPLSWRVAPEDDRVLLERTRAHARSSRATARSPRSSTRKSTRARSSLDEREPPAIMLYTSGTTGRPKGVPRSHRAERAGWPLPGDPARLPLRRPHARRDAALPHDGRPLAARHEPDRRLLRLPAELGRRGGAAR